MMDDEWKRVVSALESERKTALALGGKEALHKLAARGK